MNAEWVRERPVVPFDAEVEAMAATRDSRSRSTDRGDAADAAGAAGAAVFDRVRELESIDRALLDDEERAFLAAHQRAEEKVALYRKLAKVGPIAVLLLLLWFPGGVAFTLYQVWRLGRRTYQTLLEPRVRERLVAEEVGKRLDARVVAQRRAMESEHARSLEQLSASIAHEIRNPITAAKSLVQQMGEDPVSQTNLEYASVALEELDRVERSISHLLRFARDEELRVEAIRLQDVVTSGLETFRDRIERTGVRVETGLDTPGEMEGDADKLRRVVINLVGNAIDALYQAGIADARIEVMSGDNLAGTEVWLRVRDNGPGIPDETRARIFDPFYTTKSQGTGLGLALSRKVVEAHGGAMELESSPGTGTEFVLVFPKEQPRARDAKRPSGGERS